MLDAPRPKAPACAGCIASKVNEGFAHHSGNEHARMMFIGEALGDVECRTGLPFQGGTGKMLRTMMRQAGIDPDTDTYITNIVKCRPWESGAGAYRKNRTPNEYEIQACTERYLIKELADVSPNLIVPVGDTALAWLYSHYGQKQPGSITALRGYCFELGGQKILPVVHPSYVAQGNPEFWSITVCDLIKARHESTTRDYNQTPERFIIGPSIATIQRTLEHVHRAALPVAIDLETLGTNVYGLNIMCLGIAWSDQDALCIPLLKCGGYEYWSSPSEEREAWQAICDLLGDPRITKITQNGFPFDFPVFEHLGVRVRGRLEDTLMMHHCVYCEMPHSLAHLASLCTHKPPFKMMIKNARGMLWTDNTTMWTYNCRDVVTTWAAWKWLGQEINEIVFRPDVVYR